MDRSLFGDRQVRKRSLPPKQEEPAEPRVSQGSIDKVIDLAFNPTREKIREVTVIDRMQGRLLPQLDIVCTMRDYVIEVAEYRENPDAYAEKYDKEFPEQPKVIEDFIYRLAQWQKSVQGKNLERATDIALAETETRGEREEEYDQRGRENPFG